MSTQTQVTAHGAKHMSHTKWMADMSIHIATDMAIQRMDFKHTCRHT